MISDTLSITESKYPPRGEDLFVTLATAPSTASKNPAMIKNRLPKNVAVYHSTPIAGECNENIIAEMTERINPIHVQKLGPNPKLANPLPTFSNIGSNLFLKLLSNK